jgi:hypothetical protein
MKNRLILWLLLLVVGFLAGFIPQYLKKQSISQELTATKQQLDSCGARVAMSQLRDTASMLYLEATQKNYGTAADYSRRLFEGIQQQAGKTSDPIVKATLDDVLKSRDAITAELAKGDPAVITNLQPLVGKLVQGTKQ